MNKNEIRAESRETKRFFRRFSRPARVSEYRRLWAKADKLLDREIKKPSAKKDETLIAECVETMVYCDRQLAELHAEAAHRAERKQSSRFTLWPKNAFARAAVAAAALILILGLGTAVTKAAGLDVWSALVHWDSDYLKIDYSLREAQNDPPKGEYRPANPLVPDADPEIEYRRIGSADELRELLCSAPLYPYDLSGAEFVSADIKTANGEDEDVTILLKYNGRNLRIFATLGHEELDPEYISVATLFPGEYTNVIKKTICGTECVLAEGAEVNHLVFGLDQNLYSVSGAVSIETLEIIADYMLH